MRKRYRQRNPFPGLRSYSENESLLFFGRERQINDMLQKINRSRFLAVVGSAGSGKSSLIKAGLIPALYKGHLKEVGHNWRVVLFRPGSNPMGNLAAALSFSIASGGSNITFDREQTENILYNSRDGLYEALQKAGLKSDEKVLIVVDQFEEIFRFDAIEKSKMHFQRDSNLFVSQILSALKAKDLSIYAIFNIRSEFLGECPRFRSLPAAINEGQYLIPRMNRKERKLAVTGSIEKAGGAISDDLVSLILNDTGLSPDYLSEMQHTLMRIWNYWKKNNSGEPIDVQHYKAIGLMSGALEQHAEEVYKSLKHDNQRKICEIMFKTIPEQSTQLATSVSNTIHEIALIANCTEEEVVEVADCFRKSEHSFLTPPIYIQLRSDTPINLTHESLVKQWGRLSRWMEEEEKSADLYIRLASAAAMYQEGKAAPWRDLDLQFALQWRASNEPNAHWAKRYAPSYERAMVFLDYSNEQNNLKIEQKQQRQKAQERRSRIFTIIVGGLGMISIVATIFAFIQQSNVELQSKEVIEESKKAQENREMALLIGETAESKYQELERQQGYLRFSAENIQHSYLELKDRHDSLSNLYRTLISQQEFKDFLNDSLRQQINETKRKMQVMEHQMYVYRGQFFQSLSEKLSHKAKRLLTENKIDSASLYALYANKMNVNGKNAGNKLLHQCLKAKGLIGTETERKKIILPAKVSAIAKCPGRELIAVADIMGNIYVSSSSNTYKININKTIKTLKYNANGNLLVAATNSGDLYFWYTKNPDKSPMLLHKKSVNHQIEDIAFTPTLNNIDHYLIVKTEKRIQLYTVSMENVELIAGFDSNSTHIAASIDGQKLYVVSHKKLMVYDIDYTESRGNSIFSPAKTLNIDLAGEITQIVAGKSSHIALGDSKGNVVIYDALEEYKVKNVPFVAGSVEQLNFDTNGEQLIVVRAPSDVRFYNIILTPKEEQNIQANTTINSALWIDESNVLALTDKSNAVSFIQSENVNYNAMLCSALSTYIQDNKLTQSKWEQITGLDNSDGLNPVPRLCE